MLVESAPIRRAVVVEMWITCGNKKIEKFLKKLVDIGIAWWYYKQAVAEKHGERRDVPCKLNNEKAKDEPENS